jgi:hypothetical protein
MAKQVYDNSELGGERYKVVLEDESEMVMSEKHKVYSSEENLIGFVMMFEPVEDDDGFFNFKHEHKTFVNVDSFELFEISSEVLEMIKKNNVAVDDLFYLFSNSEGENFVFGSKLFKLLCKGGLIMNLKLILAPLIYLNLLSS